MFRVGVIYYYYILYYSYYYILFYLILYSSFYPSDLSSQYSLPFFLSYIHSIRVGVYCWILISQTHLQIPIIIFSSLPPHLLLPLPFLSSLPLLLLLSNLSPLLSPILIPHPILFRSVSCSPHPHPNIHSILVGGYCWILISPRCLCSVPSFLILLPMIYLSHSHIPSFPFFPFLYNHLIHSILVDG